MAGGGEHDVDVVALLSCEIVAIHAVAVLDAADDWIDGGATPACLAVGWKNAAQGNSRTSQPFAGRRRPAAVCSPACLSPLMP